MNSSNNRRNAKIIAWADLVISGLRVMGVVVFVVYKVDITAFSEDNFDGYAAQKMGKMLSVNWFLWIAVFICLALIGLQIWTAIKLLTSTHPDVKPVEAKKLIIFWKNANIILIVTSCLTLSFIHVIIRLIFRYFVMKYLRELEQDLEGIELGA